MTHKMLDPNMPTQELRLHMGELTSSEVLVARAAIAWANSCMAPAEGWQPIETAPKDRSPFIGWCDNWTEPIVCWWYTGLEKWNTRFSPTHWMPLPKPPKSGGE